ncbi:MAG TPA: nitrous oxide reductase family maturation protein NosD [Chitinophagaceae bacterium]|nr:nitrous oxide reductase family maturation protein NosD [Chitinophagaceae bacterium]
MLRIKLIVLITLITATSSARKIVVSPQSFFTTIKQALNAANNGDTIEVLKGIYKEKNLLIDKSIYLLGVNGPIIDGEKKYEVCSVKANSVVIDGFIIQNSGYSGINDIAGIKLYNVSHVVIKNNKIEDTYFAIYCQGSSGCVIENNTIKSYAVHELQSGNAIHCWKSDNMKIVNNNLQGHRDGIYFEFVTNSTIKNNNSHHNLRYGLHFMFSNNDSYLNNIFEKNGAGVAVMYTKGVKMIGNVFKNNWGDATYGLLLKDISDSYIEQNKFIKNTMAIYMEGSSRIAITRNSFSFNGWALKIQASCDNNVIERNNFLSNTFDVGTNGSLVLNKFYHNYWDKYEGYDLNKDGVGDVPYHPVSVYSMVIEQNPPVIMLLRSFIVDLLDKTEKIIPGLTPENLNDEQPQMKPLKL